MAVMASRMVSGLRSVALNVVDLAAAARAAAGTIVSRVASVDEPGGGIGLTIGDPAGRRIRLVHGDPPVPSAAAAGSDQPLRLAHVVLNARDVPAAQRFFETVLGF